MTSAGDYREGNGAGPAALANRGNLLLASGRASEAIACYDAALREAPDQPAIHYNRATALLELGRFDDALAGYDRALALDPSDAEAWFNRGHAQAAIGRHADAVASYDHAVALQPGDAAAWFNRGNALAALGRTRDALESFDRARAIDPANARIHYNRANALAALKRTSEAIAAFDAALAIAPGDADAWNNRGFALLAEGRPAEALASFEAALARDPRHLDALNNAGHALCDVGRFPEAAAVFARLVAASPGYRYARGNLLRAKLHACDWDGLDPLVREVTAAVGRGEPAVEPMVLLAVCDSAALQAQCARIRVADAVPPPAARSRAPLVRRDRIRVAYLSADFHEHATAHLAAGLFEAHDRARFEVVAFSFGPGREDPMRERLRRAFDAFVDVREASDDAIAALVRERGVDVAVDLKGLTAHARPGVFASRPAPVQVNFLGFPGTIGADFLDYVVADRWTIPPGDECHYVETVVRLPPSYLPADRSRPIAAPAPTRAEAGLPADAFAFACFNNDYKIQPAVFDAWMRLLAGVPDAVLWILEDTPAVAANLRREAARRSVAPERIVFAPRLPLPQHLARHALADLFLDTLPCNAHTTASDALWAGLPVVTATGAAFPGRVAASLLDAIGLPELIAPDLASYERLALALARDRARLAAIRGKLAAARDRSSLFDPRVFARRLESAYDRMWARALRGEPPEPFDVEDAGVR